MPPVGRLFVALAVVVAAIELWSIPLAFWNGATEWWSEAPDLLPQAARAGAMLLLPAAVAWASPRRFRANRWLWQGALIVAVVQLARYPVDFLRGAILQGLTEGGADFGDPLVILVNLGIGLVLAVSAVLGVWALSEGVKDAGGRGRAVVAVAALLALAFGILYIVPSVVGGIEMSVELATGLLSVAINVLFLFAHGLLAGRTVSGFARGLQPRRAWGIGSVGGVILLVMPVLSLGIALVNYFVLPPGEGIFVQQLNVLPFFGWPAVAIALAVGMGRLAAPAPSLVGTGFVMRGKGRATVAATAAPTPAPATAPSA